MLCVHLNALDQYDSGVRNLFSLLVALHRTPKDPAMGGRGNFLLHIIKVIFS